VPCLNDGDRPGGTLADVGRFGGYGLSLGIATALFAWIGSILDERFHTGPLFVLLGTFTGFGAGFYSMYRHLVLDRSDELGGVDESDPNGRSS
jgi:F0F1-type ATP synthase assembly protein I